MNFALFLSYARPLLLLLGIRSHLFLFFWTKISGFDTLDEMTNLPVSLSVCRINLNRLVGQLVNVEQSDCPVGGLSYLKGNTLREYNVEKGQPQNAQQQQKYKKEMTLIAERKILVSLVRCIIYLKEREGRSSFVSRELHIEKGNCKWEKGLKRPQSYILTMGLGAAVARTGQSFSKLEDKKSTVMIFVFRAFTTTLLAAKRRPVSFSFFLLRPR